jgi:hypothetical protein
MQTRCRFRGGTPFRHTGCSPQTFSDGWVVSQFEIRPTLARAGLARGAWGYERPVEQVDRGGVV